MRSLLLPHRPARQFISACRVAFRTKPVRMPFARSRRNIPGFSIPVRSSTGAHIFGPYGTGPVYFFLFLPGGVGMKGLCSPPASSSSMPAGIVILKPTATESPSDRPLTISV